MALAIYSKTCAKNVSGNYHKVFFGAVTDITAITVSASPYEITAITNGTKFKKFDAEIDSVQFKYEGAGAANYFTTQTLVMKFAKKTTALVAAIDELVKQVTCGVVAIHVDGNGLAWLDGYDGKATDPTARPFNKIKVTYDSGTKPSDEEGNIVVVELTRESEWPNIPFDSTLSSSILSGGATAFITY